MDIDVAIIGGSGVYSIEDLADLQEIEIETPFGKPSGKIIVGEFSGKKVAFLNRHGPGHIYPPHIVNYRANIYALHKLGVKRIIAVNACGSLREDFVPEEIVILDQFIDRTKSRHSSFFEGKDKEGEFKGVCHISMAEPFCPDLRKRLIGAAENLGVLHKKSGTYICVEGPRFSTRAESLSFQKMGADVVGMTLVPEVVLAREMGICYTSLALNTDYDCWKTDRPPVSTEEILRVMKENVEKAKKIIFSAISGLSSDGACGCANSRENAMI